MINYINEERIQELSDGDTAAGIPLYQKVLKLSEESGELSQAFLKFDKSKNTSASAKGRAEDVLEEACDCINVTMDIINEMTRDKPELETYVRELFDKKLDKWESKQKAYTETSNDYVEVPVIEKEDKPGFLSKARGFIGL